MINHIYNMGNEDKNTYFRRNFNLNYYVIFT